MGRGSKKTQNRPPSPEPVNINGDMNMPEQHDIFVSSIKDKLEARDLCTCDDEYSSISEAVAASAPIDAPPSEDDLVNVTTNLLEYFEDLNGDDAKELIYAAALDAWGDVVAHIAILNNVGEGHDIDNDGVNDNYGDGLDSDEEDDDGDFIGEGECELCERCIKLTRHHLIPRTTWPRMKKRIWNAAPAIHSLQSLSSTEKDTSDAKQMQQLQEKKKVLQDKIEKTLGMTDISHVPTTITHDSVRAYLGQICLLCRQCHSAVHRIHPSELDLATQYNTMDLLLECDEVMKFGKWASKQRPGKYAV